MERTPAVGTAEDKGPHAVGGREGQFLSDHAAHGKAQDKSLLHLQMIEEPQGIPCKFMDGVGRRRNVRSACSSVVESDGLVMCLKKRNLTEPRPDASPQAAQEQERRSLTLDLIVKGDAARSAIGHSVFLSQYQQGIILEKSAEGVNTEGGEDAEGCLRIFGATLVFVLEDFCAKRKRFIVLCGGNCTLT